MRRYELTQRLQFEVVSPSGVTPEKGNPMIYKLRDKLKDYLLTEGTISARIIDIDDFSFQQVTPNLVVARWDLIKWDVIDHDENEGRAIERFNNEMREFLASKLRELSFSRYNTDIRIIEQRFYC